MKSIELGATATRRVRVGHDRTIGFLGESLRIYATPELVRDVESTCRELLLGYVDTGEDSVGTGISLSHSGATLLGMSVEITATVMAVEGRKVSFATVARDDAEEISRGEHSRFIVDVEKLRGKAGAKMIRLKTGRAAG